MHVCDSYYNFESKLIQSIVEIRKPIAPKVNASLSASRKLNKIVKQDYIMICFHFVRFICGIQQF